VCRCLCGGDRAGCSGPVSSGTVHPWPPPRERAPLEIARRAGTETRVGRRDTEREAERQRETQRYTTPFWAYLRDPDGSAAATSGVFHRPAVPAARPVACPGMVWVICAKGKRLPLRIVGGLSSSRHLRRHAVATPVRPTRPTHSPRLGGHDGTCTLILPLLPARRPQKGVGAQFGPELHCECSVAQLYTVCHLFASRTAPSTSWQGWRLG
jgi:hypothetical protein